MTPLIIFTDLDGTLLDHDDYSHAPAAAALAVLRRNAIPLVLASSKTGAEIAPLRAELGFGDCPAIVENGAGILDPGDGADNGGDADYVAIRGRLAQMPDEWRGLFEGFGDWSVDQIAERTGLAETEAARAKQRRFSEPGSWRGDDAQLDAFSTWLKSAGITIRRGGRFITLSLGADKAQAMASIVARYSQDGADPVTIALGDAPNDTAMLEAADRGFIVANPHGAEVPHLPGEDTGRIRRTPEPGPAGWNDAVLSVLKDHGFETEQAGLTGLG